MSIADRYAAMRRDTRKAASCQQVRKGPEWGGVRPKVEERKTVEQVKLRFSVDGFSRDGFMDVIRLLEESWPARMRNDVRRWLVLPDALIEEMRDLPGWRDVEVYMSQTITYKGEAGEYFGLAIIRKESMWEEEPQ